MANNTNSKKINVPEARQAMYNMKHEVANELGITLNQGYNGNLSSKDAGQIGGNMVKNSCPTRNTKTVSFERTNRIVDGHKTTVRYIAGIAI